MQVLVISKVTSFAMGTHACAPTLINNNQSAVDNVGQGTCTGGTSEA